MNKWRRKTQTIAAAQFICHTYHHASVLEWHVNQIHMFFWLFWVLYLYNRLCMTRFLATGEKLGFLIKEKERTHQHNSDCYLTVLTTYCCVAMAGLTKSGLGPPGSHTAELFRKHAVAYHGSPEESRAHFLMWGEEYLEQVSQSSCHIIQLV